MDNDAVFALADFADDLCRLTARVQKCNSRVCVSGRHDRDHANAAVESPIHLGLFDATGALQPVEHRIAVPMTTFEHNFQAIM